MKILYVTAAPLEYSSSANMRNIALINGLIEQGHEVSTFSADIEENSKYIDKTLVDVKFKKRYWIDNSKFHTKVSSRDVEEKNLKSKIKKIIIKITYNIYSKFRIYDSRKALVKKIHKNIIEEEFDLIISSSDPKSAHLIAEKLIEENPNLTKKWIQYWGDPFANDINNNGLIPKFMIRREERRILSLADNIIYVSPFTLEKQKELYPKIANKMNFVPIPYKEKIIYKLVENDGIILGYFGDYYSKNRNIKPLYNVMKSQNDKQLIICGNSDIELEQKENIQVYNRQSVQRVRKLEENVSALVCICNNNGTQIPGKLYHYAATNKAILIIVDGEYAKEIRKYLEAYDRFIICNNNEKEILDAINKLKSEKYEYEPVERLEAKNIAEELLNK